MGKWRPEKGDKVYHVCEFFVNGFTLRQKGLEGFRTFGIEVVESTVKVPYRWKNVGTGFVSVVEKRDVGDNANNLFYWKPSDCGKHVFATREEAAAMADIRAQEMDRALGSKYENHPMYKNWLHWGDKTEATKSHQLPETFSMEAYEKWVKGEITSAEAGEMCSMAKSTFAKHASRLAKERGDRRKRNTHRKPLPEDYKELFEEEM